MKTEEAIAKLEEFIKGTNRDSEYGRGLANGMILAKALLTDEEPEYFRHNCEEDDS